MRVGICSAALDGLKKGLPVKRTIIATLFVCAACFAAEPASQPANLPAAAVKAKADFEKAKADLEKAKVDYAKQLDALIATARGSKTAEALKAERDALGPVAAASQPSKTMYKVQSVHDDRHLIENNGSLEFGKVRANADLWCVHENYGKKGLIAFESAEQKGFFIVAGNDGLSMKEVKTDEDRAAASFIKNPIIPNAKLVTKVEGGFSLSPAAAPKLFLMPAGRSAKPSLNEITPQSSDDVKNSANFMLVKPED